MTLTKLRSHSLLPLLILMLFPAAFSWSQEDPSAENEEDWYQIEYILFEHKSSDKRELRYETLPGFNAIKAARNARLQYYWEQPYFTSGNALVDNHLASIASDQKALENAYRQLNRDRRTRVLQFRAWQQSLAQGAQTLPMLIEQKIDDGRYLSGTAKVRRERYLHFELEATLYVKWWFKRVSWLDWAKDEQSEKLDKLLLPVPENDLELMHPWFKHHYTWLPFERVHLQASRRIKDGEQHYIDHPALAVVATIKGIDSPYSIRFENF